jgi:tetratricopeptide (TPR) repeat protein
VWQLKYETLRFTGFEIVSIAMEHGGAALAQPFVQVAGATFPTVVDEHGLTAVAFGFKAVPNGVLVDEAGIVRYAKYGGFSVEKGDDLAAVERFARGEDPGASPNASTPYQLGALENDLVATKLRLGRLLAEQGRLDDAADTWRAALRYDPANLVIRKQIWSVLHPEKFHPAIDWDWQGIQLAREREEEIASGICGPDGCPLPR